MLKDILKYLMNHTVIIKTSEGFQVKGEIIAFSEPEKYPNHKPGLLLMSTARGTVLIRDWVTISSKRRI